MQGRARRQECRAALIAGHPLSLKSGDLKRQFAIVGATLLDERVDVQMSVSDSAKHELGPATNAITSARAFDIFVHSVAAQTQNLSDLPVAFALCHQINAIDLAWAERYRHVCQFIGTEKGSSLIERDRPNQSGSEKVWA